MWFGFDGVSCVFHRMDSLEIQIENNFKRFQVYFVEESLYSNMIGNANMLFEDLIWENVSS